MRTPKQEALCRVIDWINDYIKNNKESKLPGTQKILSSIYPLKKEALDNSAIDSNAWLTGFIDSDGNFSINLNKRNKKHLDKVVNYMRLEVRQTYHRTNGNETQLCTNKSSLLDNSNSSYYFIMSKIAMYLDVNLNSRNRLKDNKFYSSFIITATSQKSLDILIKYLTKYPLLSSKYLDFLDWSEVIDFIKKKGNNNVPGGSWELASIKRKDFNKTRTTFTWKHLNSTNIGCNNQLIKFSNTKLNMVHLVKTHNSPRMLHTTNSSTPRPCSVENFQLNPWWVTGFIDGEGSFMVSITKKKNFKHGWKVQLIFAINLNKKDLPLLKKFIKYFLVGHIAKDGPKAFKYSVTSQKEFQVIIDHLDKYPLKTNKFADYEIWKQVFYLILKNEHLTISGLYKILALKASINRGLTNELKAEFTNITPVVRSKVKNIKISDPNWLTGFTSGEGSFMVKIKESKTIIGFQVFLVFSIGQHIRDQALLILILEFLGCGTLYKHSENAVVIKVYQFKDITEKIIPFF